MLNNFFQRESTIPYKDGKGDKITIFSVKNGNETGSPHTPAPCHSTFHFILLNVEVGIFLG